ncbi:unnamed protein product [Ophioblennius macclurei]
MEPEDARVSVWVCREEKLVSGLSRRTTCGDVVKVLLDEQNLQQAGALSGPPQSYSLVEKWRGFERVLPTKTRILRLWSAWGAEQDNVRFVLLKNEASLPGTGTGPRSAEARVVPSRDGGGGGGPGALLKGSGSGRSCWSAAAALSQERQRRVVRKAFRKLDKMKRREQGSAERMETLVHLVISQDHTIRQQVQRIRDLDREIERHEAGVHLDRIRRHGANYVQDTYLVESSSSTCSSSSSSSSTCEERPEALAQLEEYARCCEEVVLLQEELTEREALVESMTGEIQEELNRRWMQRRREGGSEEARVPEEDASCPAAAGAAEDPEAEVEELSEEEVVLEEQRLRTQLDTSLYIGLRLKTDLDAVRGDLDLSLALWETRESELLDLLAKVETLDLQQEGWMEQARGLSKTSSASANDEDSDTGLSSMTSQDSDNPPVCESLV